ncbi:gas vesicle protein [Clostridium tetanomorphum]|uniref:Uncharacterized protein n=1 Tax=Clostridium tetanomorphum TaxID=1553 RepID=A0A923J2K8_CLOTT|nr:hypothetical protein [Clostridium tetanomorphum]KAJ50287.1 hypothetical protein CTM_18630 [Clostridium tetanomorphum DSM 665]MBC2400014.1 hypothetical protein [Clostridium tetanomorphum]MBP1864546.1 gas vesicle protein [Clostridium tetanomorphum]NRS82922.1 gas vesicle protein [Clostridium tetanomorphum]NRZ98982.1 gas vesicle protein [Clostridium tetanomorphum]
MFSKFYAKVKQNRLEELDKKIKEYKEEIEKLKDITEGKNKELQHLKLDNEILMEKYSRLMQLILDRGIAIDIINKNYKIKEWDNLYLVEKNNLISICSKNNEEIKMFTKEESYEIKNLIKSREYSIVVTRVEKKFIKIQFRFK